eukprot:7791464-Alexandrium_andersonii.AAC.1
MGGAWTSRGSLPSRGPPGGLPGPGSASASRCPDWGRPRAAPRRANARRRAGGCCTAMATRSG